MRSRRASAKAGVNALISLTSACVALVVAGAVTLPSQAPNETNATSRAYYGYYSCISQRTALRRAYYSQLELIRRGLPTIVVQAEYAWAINKLGMIDGYFRYKRSLDSFCKADFIWARLFDSNNRAWWAIKYIQYIRWHDPSIHFVTYAKYPKLPPMTQAEQAMADKHWLQTEQSLLAPPRRNVPLRNFKFPSNVQILYDPYRGEACSEYHKFGPVSGADIRDAHTVLLQLLVSSIELFRLGAARSDIEKMVRHFVAYCFDGIRCKRHEDRLVKIPHLLHAAYAQNCAYLYAKVARPAQRRVITEQAVEAVYGDEVHSLVSYNSWGNTEYAVLTDTAAIPRVHRSLKVILDDDKNKDLDVISARMLGERGAVVGSNGSGAVAVAVRPYGCPVGYAFVAREGAVGHALEHCCAWACQIWDDVFGMAAHATERCCERCNAFSCVGKLTKADAAVAKWTEVVVPQFGERQRAVFHMLIV